MENIQEQGPFPLAPSLTTLLSLDELQTAATSQIAALMQQSTSLDSLSADLNILITRYNAQKSYLGYAAQWYGEKSWWLQITLIIVAAGIANLLYLPAITSLALSLVVSFLLLNHHQVSQEHDRLISEDLVNQNASVQQMQQLLLTTKDNLQSNLLILCKMNQDMCRENIRLHDNVDKVTQQVEEQKSLNSSLKLTIEDLQAQVILSNEQISAFQQELMNYKSMIEDGSLAFVTNNRTLGHITASLVTDSKKLREGATKFCTATDQLNRKVAAFPELTQVSPGSQSLLSNENRSSKSADALQGYARLQSRIGGVNITDEQVYALDNEIEYRSPQRKEKEVK